jgi:hypothetical protein
MFWEDGRAVSVLLWRGLFNSGGAFPESHSFGVQPRASKITVAVKLRIRFIVWLLIVVTNTVVLPTAGTI